MLQSKHKRRLLPVLLAGFLMLGSGYLSNAQQINNLKVAKVQDDIIITFDLKAADNPQEMYNINIYSSHNQYATVLDLKEGKNKDVFPAIGMKYVIDAKKTLSGYEGAVDFKIVATISFVPISFVYPNETVKAKNGKSVEITWKGGLENDSYKLEYSSGGDTWTTLDSDIHDHKYSWYIPKKLQKGTYTMRLTSSETRSKVAYTGDIIVSKKTSAFVVILPILAAGAGAYVVLAPGAEEPRIDTKGLPGPPDPPVN